VREDDPADAIVEEVVRILGARPKRDSFLRFAKGVAWVFATVELESEVFNGGFHQYFWNTDGALIDLAIAGYDTFGSPKRAEIARRAAQAASRELDRSGAHDHATVHDWLLAFHESEEQSSLKPLDKEWYALDEIEEVWSRRNDVIRRNPKLYAIGRGP
jgi:hypothetical protein